MVAPILHRDIKPGNILVQHRRDGEIHVKFGDFGLSREMQTSMSIVGTRPYYPPRVLVRSPQNQRRGLHDTALHSGCRHLVPWPDCVVLRLPQAMALFRARDALVWRDRESAGNHALGSPGRSQPVPGRRYAHFGPKESMASKRLPRTSAAPSCPKSCLVPPWGVSASRIPATSKPISRGRRPR